MHTIETTVLLGFLCLVILLQENIQLHERIREKAQAAYHEEVESHSLEKPKDYFKVELYTRFFSVAEDLLIRKKAKAPDRKKRTKLRILRKIQKKQKKQEIRKVPSLHYSYKSADRERKIHVKLQSSI